MLTDDQLIDELHHALETETDGIDPRPGLLDRVREELQARPTRRQRLRRLLPPGSLAIAVSGAIAVGVAVIALVVLRHAGNSSPSPVTSPPPVGTAQIAAQAPDPHGGLPWGLRTVQTKRLEACLQIGRLQSGRIGALGQDGAFHNDGRFHPISLRSPFPCGQTDARGFLFLNVFEREVPASASRGSAPGCRVGPRPDRQPACPVGDLRNVAYGVLGPNAVSITYTLNHHRVTERTGPDGAYLVVLPASRETCTLRANAGKSCVGGSGEITTPTLQSGVITAVTYRDGHVCHLPTPTSAGVALASCPNVGYTHYPPYQPPHVTETEVAAPMTVRILKAKRYCYKPLAFGSFQIPCDHGIPRGYKPDPPRQSPRIALVNISFTARLAATNHHSVYEFAYLRASGPSDCALNTGGTAATTMVPIRAGQRVTIQDYQEVCPGTYTGLVTYQPNGWPGHDTLGPHESAPFRDHSILVGRFRYVLRR